MSDLTISGAARAAGVSVETVRFYERKGLIEQPQRPADGSYRVYPEDTVRRIRFIRQAQEIGFSLRESHELLSLRADPSTECSRVRARAEATLEGVERKIERLTRIRRSLIELIAACPGAGALRECSIMGALGELPP